METQNLPVPVTPPALYLEDYADRLRPGAASSVLLWIIGAFVLIFLAWAGLTSLDRVVRGTGRVIPASELQTVSNLEGGIVERIFVRPGQKVKARDPLIRLDPLQMGADYEKSRVAFDALEARIARLQGEMTGKPPAWSAELERRSADLVDAERALHTSRMIDLDSLLAGARARIAQAERATAEARAAAAARRSARDAARSELGMIRPLVEKGIEPRLTQIQTESRLAMAGSEVVAAEAGISRAQSAVVEARSAFDQMNGEWRSRAAQELATARAEYAAQRRTLPALADRYNRTIVRAPLDGTVNRVLATTRGGTVRPGDPLVEIVPSDDSLIIEAKVKPADIAAIRIDQEATVKITAYDYAVYGGLKGRVISISPDAVVDPRTGESHYEVRVRTDSQALVDRAGKKLPLGAGMVAEVDILGGKRSIMHYILTPISRLRDTALRE